MGEQALRAIARDWEQVREQLGGDARLRWAKDNRPVIEEYRALTNAEEQATIAWLRGRVNDWVNVFRPLVRAAVQDATQAR